MKLSIAEQGFLGAILVGLVLIVWQIGVVLGIIFTIYELIEARKKKRTQLMH